ERRACMKGFVLHLVLTAAALLVVAQFVGGVHVAGFGSALLGAIVLGLVNAFVRPVMIVLTLPLTLLTFGLFLFVINALMLWLAAALVPGIAVGGFGAALLGSILLTLLNVVIEALPPDRDRPARGIPEAGAATRAAGRQSASPFPGAVRVSA